MLKVILHGWLLLNVLAIWVCSCEVRVSALVPLLVLIMLTLLVLVLRKHVLNLRPYSEEAGANILRLQARTCLAIRNPCLKIRKFVLEILTMFHQYCESERLWTYTIHADTGQILDDMAATRWHILKLKCTKFDFGWGSASDPAGGAPDP